jgi:hypothetical protein
MIPCQVLELRRYTLRPGQRDVLIGLFDQHLAEPQDDLGMPILGQFRDLDDPDRFVWLRGFADMDSRPEALAAFYGGPVWAAHSKAANATMVDISDVLLLRPTTRGAVDLAAGLARPPLDATERPRSLIVAGVYPSTGPIARAALDAFTAHVEPLLTEAGGLPLATLWTEPAPNNFPALPVREGEHVLVRLTRFDDVAAHTAHLDRLRRDPGWDEALRELKEHGFGPARHLRLQPTARSLLS